MKKLLTLIALGALLAAQPNLSQAATCAENVAVKVNGLVCDFCARSLEKTFGKRGEVEKIAVSLDTGKIDITLKPGQTLDDAIIRQLITDSGYDVVSIGRGC